MQQVAQIFQINEKKDFIDFITYLGHSSDKECAIEFIEMLKEKNQLKLSNWFNDKGYKISIKECEQLINNNDHLIHMGELIIINNY